MDKQSQTNPEKPGLSPLLEKLLIQVWMFHWGTTAAYLPTIIIVMGWVAKDIIGKNSAIIFDAKSPMAYLLLLAVILLSIFLVWRTFTSITLWRLNCIAEKYDSQYADFNRDETRLYYNSLAALVVEIPLFIFNFRILVLYFKTAFSFIFPIWTLLYIYTLIMFLLSLYVWARRHCQIYKWKKTGQKTIIC